MIVIPEGLGSNEEFEFKPALDLFKENFIEAQNVNLNSKLCIKGSHSTMIAFCRDFPILIGKIRKVLKNIQEISEVISFDQKAQIINNRRYGRLRPCGFGK